MTEWLLRMVKHGLIVLVVAVVSFTLLRDSAAGGSDLPTHLIALALLGYVTWHLGKPVWRAWRRWQRRRPKGQRPELPAPAQWITPRDQRRRNREVR